MNTDVSAFTGKKRKLLEYLLDPENRNQSVTDICKTVSVSRKHYYDCMKDEHFDATLRDVKNLGLTRRLASVAKKIQAGAEEGDPKLARLYLEWLGYIGSKGQTVNVAVHDQPQPETLPINTPEEREVFIARCKSEMATLQELLTNVENMQEGEHEPASQVDRIKRE